MSARKASRYFGVGRHCKSGRFTARAFLDGQQVWLGTFESEVMAAVCAYTFRLRNGTAMAFEDPAVVAMHELHGDVEPAMSRYHSKGFWAQEKKPEKVAT